MVYAGRVMCDVVVVTASMKSCLVFVLHPIPGMMYIVSPSVLSGNIGSAVELHLYMHVLYFKGSPADTFGSRKSLPTDKSHFPQKCCCFRS